MLDSAGIPIPAAVDALLMVLAANAPGTAYVAAAMAVVGSVAGSLFLFFVARKGERSIWSGTRWASAGSGCGSGFSTTGC